KDASTLVADALAADRLAVLAERANALAPPFVRHQATIFFSPGAFVSDGGREARVAVRFGLADESITVDYEELGAGIRRWVGISLLMACSEYEVRGDEARRSAAIEPAVVFLIDEPELHLHPMAQRDAAEWFLERS